MKTVFMFLITSDMLHDDRVRKECGTLLGLGYRVRVMVLEDAGRAELRIEDNGLEVQALGSWVRRLFPGRNLPVLTFLEMYIRALLRARLGGDVYWFHNTETSGLLAVYCLLFKIMGAKRVIWDLHELPQNFFLRNPVGRFLFSVGVGCADRVIVANRHRVEYLTERGLLAADKAAVVANYADRVFRDYPGSDLPAEVMDWLDGEPYLLAQGGASTGRCFSELVEAVMHQDWYRLIVIGPSSPEEVAALVEKYQEGFAGKVYFTGWMPQFDIIAYLDFAAASVVLYDATYANRELCAPNRLYQALARGTPVIAGNNPPMAEALRLLGTGVVLQDDGRDWRHILAGIASFREGQGDFDAALIDDYMWESQQDVIAGCLDIKRTE